MSLFSKDRSAFQIEDAYKQIHQAFLGPGHAIPSEREAEALLQEEWEDLGEPRPDETMIEILIVDAPFVRVHLRPYRHAGGSVADLIPRFLRSADHPVDLDGFVAAWNSLAVAIRSGQEAFRPKEYQALDRRVRPANFPAIHHSEAYQQLWDPAYRVLSNAESKKILYDFNARS
jgi:hypothetical protein